MNHDARQKTKYRLWARVEPAPNKTEESKVGFVKRKVRIERTSTAHQIEQSRNEQGGHAGSRSQISNLERDLLGVKGQTLL